MPRGDPDPDIGGSSGNWFGGLVGGGSTLAVSTWYSNDLVTRAERLLLVAEAGSRTSAVEVYDWRTGALIRTLPALGAGRQGGLTVRFEA